MVLNSCTDESELPADEYDSLGAKNESGLYPQKSSRRSPVSGLLRGFSFSLNAVTGSNSTAVTPSERKYGIFSHNPMNVPGEATCDEGWRVKPRTCIS